MKRICSVSELGSTVRSFTELMMRSFDTHNHENYVVSSSYHTLLSHDLPHESWYYRPDSCEADVLAGCVGNDVGGDGSITFVDLDQANFYTFLYRKDDTHGKLLLFHDPPGLIPDAVFSSTNASTTWLQNQETSPVQSTVGRLNCQTWPNLHFCNQELPHLVVVPPINATSDGSGTTKYLYSGSFAQYEKSITNCLWRRFGAEELTRRCQAQIKVVGEPRCNSCVRTGQAFVLFWNLGVLMISVVLLVLVVWLVGRSWIKRRWSASSKTLLWIEDSAGLSREGRREQLEQQMTCFFATCFVVALVNMFLPFLCLIVVGPVALLVIIAFWWREVQGRCTAMRVGGRRQRTTATEKGNTIEPSPAEQNAAA